MVSKWKICQCTEFGCKEEIYEDERHQQQQGRAFSANALKKHQLEIQKRNQSTEASSSVSTVIAVDPSSGSIQVSKVILLTIRIVINLDIHVYL